MNEKGFVSEKRFVSKKNLSRAWRRLFGKVLNSKEEIEANTSENMIAGAEAVKEVYSSLTNEDAETFNFGVKDGVRGFYTNPSRADDSFIPFKNNFTTIINIPYCYYATNSNMLALSVSSYKKIRISNVTTINNASIRIYKTTSLVANSAVLPSDAVQLGSIGNGGSEIKINLTNVDYLLLYSSDAPTYTNAHIELD